MEFEEVGLVRAGRSPDAEDDVGCDSPGTGSGLMGEAGRGAETACPFPSQLFPVVGVVCLSKRGSMRCVRMILRRLRPVLSSLYVSAALVGLRSEQDAVGRGQAAEEEQRCSGRNFHGRNGSQSCELDRRFWVFSKKLDDASPGCWDDMQQIGKSSPSHDLGAIPVV